MTIPEVVGEEHGVADPPADHLVADRTLERALSFLVVCSVLNPDNET
jgi:hypothetical protein